MSTQNISFMENKENWGISNEYPQHMFSWRNKKNIYMKTVFTIIMYMDRQAWANSIDPDETLQNVASYQGLHCLPLIQQFLDTTSGSKLYLFKF